MKRYLLAIDVGNTATSVGVYDLAPPRKNPSPLFVWTFGSASISGGTHFTHSLRDRLKKARLAPSSFNGAIVSSVVPAVDKSLARQLKAIFPFRVPFVSNRMKSKVRVRYKAPEEVGADRIVNARAAMALWKGPSIVIDFGTATTFDCVTASGAYLGGVIAPGPMISAQALYERTAKLPMVLLTGPVSILGRNTLESIQAGLFHGYRGLVKEIVEKLRKKLGARTQVMATGGQAHWILKGVSGVDRHVPNLTLLGLFHMWQDTRAAAPKTKEKL